jgi:hypothetical protein
VKSVLALAILVLALATGSTAAHGGVRTFSAELTGVVTSTGGWCCGTTWTFDGRGTVPTLGALSFSGGHDRGVLPGESLEVSTVQLILAFRNGDALTLVGRTTWPIGDPAPVLSWSLTGGTGRFASASGSGTYGVDVVDDTVKVTLTGTLTTK